MARRTGPIRRVRNRRNVDVSEVPLPYPQLQVAQLDSFYESQGPGDPSIATFRFQSVDGVSVWTENYLQITGLPTITWGGVQATVIEEFVDTTITYMRAFFDVWPLVPDVPLRNIAWDSKLRGLNGEWIAPFEYVQ